MKRFECSNRNKSHHHISWANVSALTFCSAHLVAVTQPGPSLPRCFCCQGRQKCFLLGSIPSDGPFKAEPGAPGPMTGPHVLPAPPTRREETAWRLQFSLLIWWCHTRWARSLTCVHNLSGPYRTDPAAPGQTNEITNSNISFLFQFKKEPVNKNVSSLESRQLQTTFPTKLKWKLNSVEILRNFLYILFF